MPPKCRRNVTPHCCTWRNFKFPHPKEPVGVRDPLPMLLTKPESLAHRTTYPSLFLLSQVMLIGTRNDKTQILPHVCTREQPITANSYSPQPKPGTSSQSLRSHALPAKCSTLSISSTFNSDFSVLFNFRSRYLFAIGLAVIFSFTRNLPRI
jgi:hypothetical protein